MYSPTNSQINPEISRNSFHFLHIIGKGGFGRVWKVQSKKTKVYYALKEMSKVKILDKKSEKSINSERLFLSKLHHPFIINMHFAFQDNENLYLVIDLLNGGDLRYQIARNRRFTEEQTKFFISNLLLSLKYIHSNRVIHRDVKPENLVLDSNGYLCLTDFGIAKENCKDNSSETSGTPGYMAPEVMRRRNHSYPVDFFAIGVIGYEFMTGRRPYVGANRKEIRDAMLTRQARISSDNWVRGWSSESVDFINKCLMRKVEERLGFNGVKELIEHKWFEGFKWKEVEMKKIKPPFVPEKKDNFDKRYCERIEKITEGTRMRYEELAKGNKIKIAFDGFYYMPKNISMNSTKLIHSNSNININNENITVMRHPSISNEFMFNSSSTRNNNNNNTNNKETNDNNNNNNIDFNRKTSSFIHNKENENPNKSPTSSSSYSNIFASTIKHGHSFSSKNVFSYYNYIPKPKPLSSSSKTLIPSTNNNNIPNSSINNNNIASTRSITNRSNQLSRSNSTCEISVNSNHTTRVPNPAYSKIVRPNNKIPTPDISFGSIGLYQTNKPRSSSISMNSGSSKYFTNEMNSIIASSRYAKLNPRELHNNNGDRNYINNNNSNSTVTAKVSLNNGNYKKLIRVNSSNRIVSKQPPEYIINKFKAQIPISNSTSRYIFNK